jgi:hypothetical protein
LLRIPTKRQTICRGSPLQPSTSISKTS